MIHYPEEAIIQELMWEFDCDKEQAKSIVEQYTANNQYDDLCQLIQHRNEDTLRRELRNVQQSVFSSTAV